MTSADPKLVSVGRDLSFPMYHLSKIPMAAGMCKSNGICNGSVHDGFCRLFPGRLEPVVISHSMEV